MFSFEPRYLFEGNSPLYGSGMPAFDIEDSADLVAAKKFTDVIVLIEGDAGEALKNAYLEKGINAIHCPIDDFGIPSFEELTNWIPQIVDLVKSKDHKILIHCMGGCGRTGLISACVFAALKSTSGQESIRSIRERIPHAVETSQQESCVCKFAKNYFSKTK